jgi:hypothetical protein
LQRSGGVQLSKNRDKLPSKEEKFAKDKNVKEIFLSFYLLHCIMIVHAFFCALSLVVFVFFSL